MTATPEQICSKIKNSLTDSGMFSADEADPAHHWRISPDPYFLTPDDCAFFEGLGEHLLKFYGALNRLYLDSAKGKAPAWVAEYLDLGKPSDLIDFGKMKRFKNQLPGIIRPDVIVTETGFSVTELDSVPGGFGVTAGLMDWYAQNGWNVLGQANGGLPSKFQQMIESYAGKPGCTLALVVSDESRDYLREMQYLGKILNDRGFSAYVVHPKEVLFKEEGLSLEMGTGEVAIDVIYRFFELFDLKNIQKSELLMFSAKKGRVRTTPPYKHYLEEKLSFALFHHPALNDWWEKALGVETFALLAHLIPNTWILDNRPLPPHAVIPDLVLRGNPVNDWQDLYPLTQKERRLVIKPSGFSPESWGSRGVVIGHDVSSKDWQATLDKGLGEFPAQPYILQKFHKGKRVTVRYWDVPSQSLKDMESRVRLTPYYFVIGDRAELGGILATLVPHDKKKIHGMVDAVLAPCART